MPKTRRSTTRGRGTPALPRGRGRGQGRGRGASSAPPPPPPRLDPSITRAEIQALITQGISEAMAAVRLPTSSGAASPAPSQPITTGASSERSVLLYCVLHVNYMYYDHVVRGRLSEG